MSLKFFNTSLNRINCHIYITKYLCFYKSVEVVNMFHPSGYYTYCSYCSVSRKFENYNFNHCFIKNLPPFKFQLNFPAIHQNNECFTDTMMWPFSCVDALVFMSSIVIIEVNILCCVHCSTHNCWNR